MCVMASIETHCSHYGIYQLALGQLAQGENTGFKINK